MTTPFKFLAKINNDSILFAITDEHPQTIAVILSCLPPAQAMYIIRALPPERQLSVIRRIAAMRPIEAAVIKLLEEELRATLNQKKFIKLGGVDTVAETMLEFDKTDRANILENLAQDDPDLVDEIVDLMRSERIMRQREDECYGW